MTVAMVRVWWRRSSDIAFCDDGERLLVLDLADPTTSKPHLLTSVAMIVWRALEHPLTEGQLTSRVGRESLEPITTEQVLQLMQHLREMGLCRRDAD